MRKLPLVALVLIVGCGCGPARLRPGSDMALPERVGLTESLLRSLACSAEKSDSLQKTPATTARDGARATCGPLKESVRK
jgi:hypothetical protein